MAIPRNLSTLAQGTNSSGVLGVTNGGTGSTSTTFVNLASNVTGTLPVANGGTGAATLTANNVLLGNGTSALQAVAPGTTGNVLTSNGTTWASTTPAGGGSWVYISTVTASNSATVSITGLSSTYDMYVVELIKVIPSTASNETLQIRTSTNGGSTYDSGISDYQWGIGYFYVNGTFASTWAINNDGIRASQGTNNSGSNLGNNGFIYITKPSDASYCQIYSDLHQTASGGLPGFCFSVGERKSNADVDAIRFFYSAGNITSGTFRLYGIKNS